MKQGELKRALLVFSILCILICIYFYWQQATTISADRLVFTYKHPQHNKQKKSDQPQWTWQCINQRCERHHIKDTSSHASSTTASNNNIPKVSLSTCSMLCGSTQLWPQPTGPVTLGSRAVTFTHHQLEFETNCQEPARSLLEQAYAAFNDTIVSLVENKDYTNQQQKQTPEVKRFLIKVTVTKSNIVRLKLDTNEAYTLTIKPHGDEILATIAAQTFFGARHGLETLSQLVWWDEYASSTGMLKILKAGTIQDAPMFAYRGIMVDTARNFMSVESLKRVLVGMGASKLNVFHWHITDSQSFPLVLHSVPQLAQNGAYSPSQVYTPAEVRALVEFARVRGVRVVLEVDVPAHAGNGWQWGPREGLGDLAVCVNARPWSVYCGEPPCGQLNPDNPNVFDILEKIYREMVEITGEEELFHLGGDEVNLECWAQHLQHQLSNYTDLHDLWGEFTLKALKKLEVVRGGGTGGKVIVWSSNLSKRPYVSKYFDKGRVVVQSWGASQWPDTPELVADGYEVVLSHVDAWYLDCGFGRWRETGDAACDPYRPWQTMYNHRPWQQLRLNRKKVLGGEACLWSEQVEEGSLDARLWPRAAAFAERVWSDPQLDVNTFAIQEDVYTRLNTHRERLVGRGLGAEALWPVWCSQNPGMCL